MSEEIASKGNQMETSAERRNSLSLATAGNNLIVLVRALFITMYFIHYRKLFANPAVVFWEIGTSNKIILNTQEH